MELNGFNSDNYRYFYLNSSKDWSGFCNLSYGVLKENDIIKLSKEDLVNSLFSDNYRTRIVDYIYPHSVTQYPDDKPFDLFEYLYMQKPITFKWDGTLCFIYGYGEFAYINNWMSQKMNSCKPSRRLVTDKTIQEENEIELSLIRDEEIFKIMEKLPLLEGMVTKESDTNSRQLSKKLQHKIFRFKNTARFELEYHKGETWSLMDSSVFLAVFDQDFIRLLANSTEILDQEKERIFTEEYQDNIPNSTRKYYRVKNGVTVEELYQIMGDCSLEHFDRGFNSLIVRMNAENVNTCYLNRENFNSDGSIKYFYVDYSDSLNDRIAEQEILKIADRVSQHEALEIEQRNSIAITERKALDEAIEYINKNKKSYKKFCHRNPGAMPVDFVKSEKKKQISKLLGIMQSIYHIEN